MKLGGLLEIALYHDSDEEGAMAEMYGGALGLDRVAAWPDGAAYRLGSVLVLLFARDRLAEREGPIADHGSAGPGHACFTVPAGEYEAWLRHVAGVAEITHEHEWKGGRRSFYFHDPAGNLLEIADGDLWPAEADPGQ
jgi:catechol 2,3-dioxygenase-like lactoylglutathione lyase family enzyme